MNATNRPYMTQLCTAMPLIPYLPSKSPITLNAAETLNDRVILILGVGITLGRSPGNDTVDDRVKDTLERGSARCT